MPGLQGGEAGRRVGREYQCIKAWKVLVAV